MPGLTQKSSKKRAAPVQKGPVSKKPHLDKTKSDLTAQKKRSRPVTLPVAQEVDDDDEEDEDDDSPFPIVEEDGEDDADAPEADDDAMQVDGEPARPPKDPNAARETHKAQKAIHQQRIAQKPNSDLLAQAKKAWSLARRKNIPAAERQKDVKVLMDVMRGKVKEIVFKHDASRIVQTVVKYGGQKEREEIVLELKGRYKELAQSRYSKFLITKLIRLCPAHRASILTEFQGHVRRLLLHREASSVLADAFELYANAYERSILLRDFYGKEAMLFSNPDQDKEKAKKGLSGVLEDLADDAGGEKSKRVLNAVKENLTSIFNNEDKGAVTHAVVHHALWEYISALETLKDESERERQRREMFETCQDIVAELVHTKDGSRVVREFLARGTAKDRKQILKVLKPHIERMCIDDEAQLVLFTSLDVIDDTKLLHKSLISSITTPSVLNALYKTPQGRRSIIYLILPRTKRHFTPAQIRCIEETDAVRDRAGTSKKDSVARESEVRAAASEGLVAWLESVKESSCEVVKDPGGSLVVAEIMLFAEGDKTTAQSSLLSLLTPSDTATPHPITLPHISRLYKTLLQGGHFSHQTKSISPAPTGRWDPQAFAKMFVEKVGEEGVVGMCVPHVGEGDSGSENGSGGEGCFVVAELVETVVSGRGEDAKPDEATRKTLKSWFGEDVKKKLEGGEAKGKTVLLEKLKLL